MKTFAALPEDFLHFVWRTRQYEPLVLKTIDGRRLEVRSPGVWNHDQGPDFSYARLVLDGVSLLGMVEIHVYSKDWYLHKHHVDPVYNPTVLHLVLQSDGRRILREDGTSIPEVCIEPYLKPAVIRRYLRFKETIHGVPCKDLLPTVPMSYKRRWVERMAVERMEAKANYWENRLAESAGDWAQICWEALLKQMGSPVNADSFAELAQRLPFKLMRSYHENFLIGEALIFGALGMLENKKGDEYYLQLKNHWDYYGAKHKLKNKAPLLLKFSRMRPANFPTIRLSQCIDILRHLPNIADILLQAEHFKALAGQIACSPYWENHTRFGTETKKKKKPLGENQLDSLLLNVVAPISFLYHRRHGSLNSDHFERYLAIVKAEKNRYTRLMEKLEFPNENAFFSQGLLHLYRNYCLEKRCLQCQIGQSLLVSSPKTS
ncbi:MAG: DUF2851 family protein [Bacteroidota bacterium]